MEPFISADPTTDIDTTPLCNILHMLDCGLALLDSNSISHSISQAANHDLRNWLEIHVFLIIIEIGPSTRLRKTLHRPRKRVRCTPVITASPTPVLGSFDGLSQLSGWSGSNSDKKPLPNMFPSGCEGPGILLLSRLASLQPESRKKPPPLGVTTSIWHYHLHSYQIQWIVKPPSPFAHTTVLLSPVV
jgi:hypothetical protein